jgi:hypothetical protein
MFELEAAGNLYQSFIACRSLYEAAAYQGEQEREEGSRSLGASAGSLSTI